MIFAGMVGSAVADAAGTGAVEVRAMKKAGYRPETAAAISAAAATIGPIIPPSLPMVIYGVSADVSIGRLFLAGVIPGLMMMTCLMVTAYVIAKRRNYVVANTERPSFGALASAVWGAKWALLFPVALVLAIRGGVFTPSEVGSFAVVYAIVIGFFVHRELTFDKLRAAFTHSISDIGLIMIIILMSGMVGFAIIYLQVPQHISTWMLTGLTSPSLIVLVILLFLLIAGCFIESTVLVLLLTPIFVPVVSHVGIDPVHFGILMMSIVTLGGMTPPVGVAMFAVCSLMDVKIEEYTIEALPFLATVIVLIAFLLFFPGIVLWLPNLAFG
jgi:tripartite ATP-independent transporter DctM subunit